MLNFLLSFLALSATLLAQSPPSVSIYALDTRSGKVLLDHNGECTLIPASCTKLVTTGSALELLDPDMRYETQLAYDGYLDEGGTLHGNLYIIGGGDPTLGASRIGVTWEDQLKTWEEALKKEGIQKIEGEVIGDSSLWEKAFAPEGWADEDLGNYYGACASALTFSENAYTLTLIPGKHVGENVKIAQQDPPQPHTPLFNELKSGPQGSGDRASILGGVYAPTQRVHGTVPCGVNAFRIRGAISEPEKTCATLLAERLDFVQGSLFPPPGPKKCIHKTLSPSLHEIIYWTNQKSINLYAEHLLKTIGSGSLSRGLETIHTFWEKKGIKEMRIYDGSGLSVKNALSAKQLVLVLSEMKKSPHFELFLNSLPEKEPGCRGKSGTMKEVTGYAGYLGDTAFAILTNETPKEEAKQIIDQTLSSLKDLTILQANAQ